MRRYSPNSLSKTSETFLAGRRKTIVAQPDHAARARVARDLFDAKANRAFREVLGNLVALSPGGGQDRGYCFYCENDRKAAIEHIFPLAHYPEKSHDYPNFVLVCSVCNSVKKSDKFAVFDNSRTRVIEFSRVTLQGLPPPAGDPVLLDIRREDPLAYLLLDLSTGVFLKRPGLGIAEGLRAEYTIRTIGLNDDALPTRRMEYFHMYWKLLELLGEAVQAGDADRETRIRTLLDNAQHPTVLIEMRRQSANFIGLTELVALAPANMGA